VHMYQLVWDFASGFPIDCVQIFYQIINLKLKIWEFWSDGSRFNLALQRKFLLWRAWILRKHLDVLVQKLVDEYILVLRINTSIKEAHEKIKKWLTTQKMKQKNEWKLESLFLKVVSHILIESVIVTHLYCFITCFYDYGFHMMCYV
jgi:hypothetical protein